MVSADVTAPLKTGARIANARGVPGTLGCILRSAHETQVVALTSYHVLFGAGAREGDAVWAIDAVLGARRLGHTLYGKLGTITIDGTERHVDCAVAALDLPVPVAETVAPAPSRGDRVWKTGAASGTTQGVVVDVAYPDEALVEERVRAAPGQLAVRSRDRATPFSGAGDSGAVLRDAGGGLVGLLWGCNHRGESVACPIWPVLYVLGLAVE